MMKEIPLLKAPYPKPDLFNLRNTLKIPHKLKTLIKHETLIHKAKIKDFHLIGTVWDKILLFFDPFSLNIVALDQHAVHERICYEILCERLEKELFNEEGFKGIWDESLLYIAKNKERNVTIGPSIYKKFYQIQKDFSLEEDIIKEILLFKRDFEKWGFSFDYNPIDLIHNIKIPLLFNEELDLKRFCEDFLAFFKGKDLIKHKYPAIVDEILMSKACKNAIKFNDRLNRKQISLLKENLGQCDYPFVCVHGRNSIFPLINLRS